MAVKIRLTRVGKKKAPFYRIVAVDSRKKRDGEYLDNLGTYEALSGKIVDLNQERIDYWLSQGAQLSDSAKKLIKLSKKEKTVAEKPPVRQAQGDRDTVKKAKKTEKSETKTQEEAQAES